jgi:hypothetical protein
MKMTISPVTAALILAAAVTVEFVVAVTVSSRFLPWTAAVNLAMFLCLCLYGIFLARLSGQALRAIAAPLLILASVLAVAESPAGFVVPATAVLSWVRSGICFQGPIFRRLASETATCPAGLAWAALLHPADLLTGWAMGVWMFFLVQALYFLTIDPGEIRATADTAPDGAAAARIRAAELLREQRLERVFAALELSSRRDLDK